MSDPGVRRRASRRLVLAVALAAAGVVASGCRSPQPPPSVLLVVVDTLRADHLGLYGHVRETTPHLDRRAARAAVFERAYSTSSWTLPAIGSILTGRLPPAHGARALDPAAPARETEAGAIIRGTKTFARLRAGVPTIAERLAARGYATAAITSNPFLDPRFGLDRGFEAYDQQPRRRAPAVTDRALAWLGGRPAAPFFLFVHYMDPHLPYRPPPEHRGAFTARIRGSELDYSVAGVQSVRRALPALGAASRAFLAAAYDEEIAFVDGELERLFAGVEGLGLWRDTLVVMTSDHGEELFEHGGFEHGHSLYDEVLRVPLLVWGRDVRPGRRDHPVSLADLAPTILAAAGDGPAAASEMAGASLWPLLAGEAAPASRTLFAQDLLHGPDQLAAIEFPYKAIVRLGGDALQLFDLSRDPAETDDLAAAEAPAARRLVARARAAAGRITDPLEAIELDDGTLGELRALGYVD